MYKIPPTDNITLEEFEEFAIDRLKGTYARDHVFGDYKLVSCLKNKSLDYFSLHSLLETLRE